MSWLSQHELEQLISAESMPALPIPTRPVSSDEFTPAPQSQRQRQFEVRVQQLGSELARKQGLSRRRFFQTPAGMAAAFLAMNETFGPLFGVSRAEAATPEQANERSAKLSGQFIMDMHTHFLRPGTRIMGFVAQRNAVGKAGWNAALGEREQTIDDLMFQNYIKEIYLDSDTKVACISGAPSEKLEDWFLTNKMKAEARANVNAIANQGLGLRLGDNAVSWLPLYHDMGLVGYVFMPLILGCPVHLMSPSTFITRPGSWLGLITAVRATISTA
jgi:hypothetical protein